MTAAATFPCPWCGASLTPRRLGPTPACPFCRRRITVPERDGASSTRGGDTETYHGVDALAASEWPVFSSELDKLAIAHEPDLGFLLVGAHAPRGEKPRLRAIDVYNKRILWDALHGEPWVAELDSRTIGARGNNLYLTSGRAVVVRDLATGERKWAAQLTQKVETRPRRGARGGPEIADACAPGTPSAPRAAGVRAGIVVRSANHTLSAFDRDSGQTLWSRRVPTGSFKQFESIEGGAVAIRYWQGTDGKLELLDPFRFEPIKSPGFGTDADFQRIDVVGRLVLAKVEEWGDDERDGLLVLDGPTGKEVFFERVPLLSETAAPVAGWNRVYGIAKDGEVIFCAPGGPRSAAPRPGHRAAALCAAGSTLFVSLRRNKSVRRVMGLDPLTLAPRFDCGEVRAPANATDRQMATDGRVLVAAHCPGGETKHCVLRAFDASSGVVLWSRPAPAWVEHFFLGGYLVSWASESFEILNPDDGEPIAGYPFAS